MTALVEPWTLAGVDGLVVAALVVAIDVSSDIVDGVYSRLFTRLTHARRATCKFKFRNHFITAHFTLASSSRPITALTRLAHSHFASLAFAHFTISSSFGNTSQVEPFSKPNVACASLTV